MHLPLVVPYASSSLRWLADRRRSLPRRAVPFRRVGGSGGEVDRFLLARVSSCELERLSADGHPSIAISQTRTHTRTDAGTRLSCRRLSVFSFCAFARAGSLHMSRASPLLRVVTTPCLRVLSMLLRRSCKAAPRLGSSQCTPDRVCANGVALLLHCALLWYLALSAPHLDQEDLAASDGFHTHTHIRTHIHAHAHRHTCTALDMFAKCRARPPERGFHSLAGLGTFWLVAALERQRDQAGFVPSFRDTPSGEGFSV